MESRVLWEPWSDRGLEDLHLQETAAGVRAEGVITTNGVTSPLRFWYQIQADDRWNITGCQLHLLGDASRQFALRSDRAGHWTDATGRSVPTLDGCIDIDISLSPFTNTFPIRRLALQPGQSEEILVAYISAPELSVRPARQRYTCLEQTVAGGLYRFESLESGFTADLSVDAQGLVLDYPDHWKRVQGPACSQHSTPLAGALFADGPAAELADHMQLFGQFVGAWDCLWTGYAPDGSTQTNAGEIHFAWVLEGRAIQDLWIFPSREERRQGLPVDEYGTTLRFYDDTIGEWRIVWTGPVGRNARVMTARKEGDEIVVSGDNRQGHPLRWVFSNITEQSFHWSNWISEDGRQPWRLQEELEARRVSPHHL